VPGPARGGGSCPTRWAGFHGPRNQGWRFAGAELIDDGIPYLVVAVLPDQLHQPRAGRSALPMLANAATGSAKNMVPNRLMARSKRAGGKRWVWASACTKLTLRRPSARASRGRGRAWLRRCLSPGRCRWLRPWPLPALSAPCRSRCRGRGRRGGSRSRHAGAGGNGAVQRHSRSHPAGPASMADGVAGPSRSTPRTWSSDTVAGSNSGSHQVAPAAA
jgi:hypothetical protein